MPQIQGIADLEGSEVAMFDQANMLKIQKQTETSKKKGGKKKNSTRGSKSKTRKSSKSPSKIVAKKVVTAPQGTMIP